MKPVPEILAVLLAACGLAAEAQAQQPDPVTSIEPPGLASVALRVHHMEAMVAFYSEAFGIFFEEVDARGVLSHFGRLGNLTLKLVPLRESTDFEGYPSQQLGFVVDDVEAVITLAIAHGGRQEGELLRDGDRIHAAVRDPDGNTIELYCRSLVRTEPAAAGVSISLRSGNADERAADAQLRRLLDQHPVPGWIFTKSLILEQGKRPHSHPILTLNTRHLDDDDAAYATFLHEQFHWYVSDKLEADHSAIDALRGIFPTVPVGRPEGARSEFSTYLHLIVCRLEYLSLVDLVGEERAGKVFDAYRFYTWIVRQVVDRGPEIDRAMATSEIVLPPRGIRRADLNGIWDFRTATPLQRPRALADQELFLTREEAAAFELETRQRRRAAFRKGPTVHPPDWLDYGRRVQPSLRTSLIVDPPDGRVPALSAEAKARETARRARLRRPAHGPEDRSPWERCLTGFNAGPPINPGAYNNQVQIVQTPSAIVIHTEMVHEARIVHLEGRPHLPLAIRLWQGDSIGRWEGEELVVETTNFSEHTSFMGSGPDLRVIERFRRIDAETLLYAYTVDDPESFVRPFSAEILMRRGGPIYEYACHEGNYGLRNMLKAARAEDREERSLHPE